MIITCQNCNTQYYLSHQALSPDGKEVKCSKCKTVWYQNYVKPPAAAIHNFDAKSFNSKKSKIFLPAVIKKQIPSTLFHLERKDWDHLCLALEALLQEQSQSQIH